MKDHQISLSERFKRLIGGETLGKDFYKLLAVHTFFLIFTRLPGIFINTLLLGQTQELTVVLTYNAAFFLSGALFMTVAAQVLHRTNPGVTVIIGLVSYNILYLSLMLLGDNASDYYIFLGIFTGFADAFYWISYGQLLSDATSIGNQDSGLSIISIFGSIVNLLIPLISGALISFIGGIRGYVTIFALAFIISLGTAALSFRLPKNKRPAEGKVDYRKSLGIVGKNQKLLYSLLGQGMKGVREGAFTFILNIVLFQLVSSELLVGVNTFLSAIAAIISFMIISRVMNVYNRINFMGLSVIALTVIFGIGIFQISPVMIVVFSVLNAFFAAFLENPCYATFLAMLQLVPEADAHRPEMLSINESFLVIGRLLGLGIIVLFYKIAGTSLQVQLVSLFVLTLTQFLTVYFNYKALSIAEQQGDI